MLKKAMFKKANEVSRKKLMTPHPSLPTRALKIREISMGEITDSIAPDDHLEGPYLLKTR